MEKGTHVGTIAQEIQQVAPFMITDWDYTSEDGSEKETYLGVDYGAMDFILVNAIKEQQQMINDQEDEIAQLKAQLEAQQQEIQQIKALLTRRD